MQSKNLSDYLPGVIAILLWSTGAYFIYQMKHIPAREILVIGQLFGGLICLYLEGGQLSIRSISRRIKRGWGALAVFWLSQFGYVYAFQNAPPAQIDLIFYTWPAILIIVRSWDITQGLNRWDIAGIILGFLGIVILLSPELKQETISFDYLSGYIGGAVGAVGWVLYLLSIDPMRKDNKEFKCIGEDIFILGILNFSLLLLTNSWVKPVGTDWYLLAYYAISMFGVPYFLWRITLHKDPKMAGALSNATPILSIIWLIIAGITSLTVELLAAIVFVKSGIYCIDRAAKTALPRSNR